jgi:hypothetical protein
MRTLLCDEVEGPSQTGEYSPVLATATGAAGARPGRPSTDHAVSISRRVESGTGDEHVGAVQVQHVVVIEDHRDLTRLSRT